MDSREPTVTELLENVLAWMRKGKSEQRTERDRYIAIAVTDLEKVLAFWAHFVEGSK